MNDAVHPELSNRSSNSTLKVLVVLVVVILLVLVAIAGVQFGRTKNSSTATISVSGTGTVRGTPDTVTFDVGVHTVADTASAALDENNAKVNALVSALERNGVVKKNLQTSGLNIYQNTNSNGDVTGFSVDNTLNVTMHDVGRSGAALDAAVRTVGNGIILNGINFSISDQSSLLAQARSQAMRNAHTAAADLARASGTGVKAVVRISDQEQTVQPVFYANASFAAVGATRSAAPIEAGRQTVSVSVSVVYALAS
jgi:uncharacterized protein YggE